MGFYSDFFWAQTDEVAEFGLEDSNKGGGAYGSENLDQSAVFTVKNIHPVTDLALLESVLTGASLSSTDPGTVTPLAEGNEVAIFRLRKELIDAFVEIDEEELEEKASEWSDFGAPFSNEQECLDFLSELHELALRTKSSGGAVYAWAPWG